MLVGFNSSTIQVNNVIVGDFSIKFHLRSKNDGFEWALVPVYGAAQDDKKSEFLSEIVRMCGTESLPILVGGDFNILRKKKIRIMIILTPDGLFSLMRSLKVWT